MPSHHVDSNVHLGAIADGLETGDLPVDEISAEAGCPDASFFRGQFKRLTGLAPSHYRRMFQPILSA